MYNEMGPEIYNITNTQSITSTADGGRMRSPARGEGKKKGIFEFMPSSSYAHATATSGDEPWRLTGPEYVSDEPHGLVEVVEVMEVEVEAAAA